MQRMPFADGRFGWDCQEVFSHRSAVAVPISEARGIYRHRDDQIGREVRRQAIAHRRIRYRNGRRVRLAPFLAAEGSAVCGARTARGSSGIAQQIYQRPNARYIRVSGDAAVKLAFACAAMLAGSLTGFSQGLDPAVLLKPAGDAWPTFNGDYSGRHYSGLKQ